MQMADLGTAVGFVSAVALTKIQLSVHRAILTRYHVTLLIIIIIMKFLLRLLEEKLAASA